MQIVENGEAKSYQVLAEFPFDSTRKRMSVIIKENDRYYLLCKGADNIMQPRIQWKKSEKESVHEDLHSFAVDGLRTLVMAKKEITQKDYLAFKEQLDYLEASTLFNKDNQIFELYDKYEQDLEYIGASAIEDKLQDDVSGTISLLMEANIRVWVLTGDKQETAIEIAKSCHLIQTGMEAEILTVNFDNCLREPAFMLEEKIKEVMNKYSLEAPEVLENQNGTLKRRYVSEKAAKYIIPSLSVVIDGPTLGLILGNHELEFLFFTLAIHAKSVV